jgi:membrane protein
MSEALNSRLDAKALAARVKRLARHVWGHFQEDRCFEEAASLSYTSLLSMVPLLAVVFGIVSAFPVFNEWSSNLQSLIFDNFLPDTGEQIVPHINTFLDSVSSLTLPGTLMLFVTALLLMVRIEVAFNRIWRVDRNRSLTNRIVMYWAVLTLGPLLIAAAIALSAQRIFGATGIAGGLPPGLQTLGIFLLSWLVFTLFFVLVPNRRVRFRDALIGAFLSTVLFSLAKIGFVAYVSNTNYKVIYGALATVPIFLFWLYLVWIVVLLGASLAASLTTFSDYSRTDSDWPERWEFQLVLRLVGHLAEAQKEGIAVSRERMMELEPLASELQILRLLSGLGDAKIATRDEEGDWLLARDLGSLSLGRLYLLGDYYLPLGEIDTLPRESDWDRAYLEALELIRHQASGVWDRPLEDLYTGQLQHGETS